MTIDLENKIGIVLLTNKITYLNEELAQIVLDWAKNEPVKWTGLENTLMSRNVKFSWEEGPLVIQPHGLDSGHIKSYAGRYDDIQYGSVSIEPDHDTLNLYLLPTDGQVSGFLEKIHSDTLQVVFRDPFVPSGRLIFRRTRKGKISAFRLDIPPGDFIFDHFLFRKRR